LASFFAVLLFKDLAIFNNLAIAVIAIQSSSLIWFYFLNKSTLRLGFKPSP
jgi:hypothetical protein